MLFWYFHCIDTFTLEILNWKQYCYTVPQSVVVTIMSEHLRWTRHGRKSQICSWNLDAVYHSSRDISTSGLGGHIAIFHFSPPYWNIVDTITQNVSGNVTKAIEKNRRFHIKPVAEVSGGRNYPRLPFKSMVNIPSNGRKNLHHLAQLLQAD